MFKTALSLMIIIIVLIGCESMLVNDKGKTIIQTHEFNMSSIDTTTAGILERSSSALTLGTTYSQPHQFIIYYGELNYSGITDYSIYDFIIVSDRNLESVTKVREQGVKVFQYIPFGSRFENSEQYMESIKTTIKSLQEQGIADGIFLDECDIAYWNIAYQEEVNKQQIFHSKLQETTEYIKSLGMESVVNGTRSFAELGDYYLWESYVSYWNSNQLVWDSSISLGRTASADGETTYGRRFTDWSFEGTTYIKEGKVVGGEQGAMEIVVDMDRILKAEDNRAQYDWIYPQWKGTGGSNDTVFIQAWIGNSLPFDSNTWTEVPDLWTSEADSWIGIGKQSKYLKLRFEFIGANQLSMEQVLLKFNYNYPYWDMDRANGAADTNAYIWNFNNSQLDYIEQKNAISPSTIKTLTQSYGELDDEVRINYTFLNNAVHELYGWSYAHPSMQTVKYYDILSEPLGMLLRQEQSGKITTGYFTGSTATIDKSSHTATIARNQGSYYFDDAITIDGKMTDWSNSDQLYMNPNIVEDAAVTSLSMTDDRQYLYIKLKVAGHINFDTDANGVPQYFYNTYIDSNGQLLDGFKGSWWNSEDIAATYKISNGGLYKWDDSFTDQHSNEGWKWLGEQDIDYIINSAGDEIEYRISKHVLGDLTSETIKFYVTVDEANTMNSQFIPPDYLNGAELTEQLSYLQKVFQPYIPHGFIQSEIIEVNEGKKATLTWSEVILDHTAVKAWIRMRSVGSHSWGSWQEIKNGQIIDNRFDRIQYSLGLYTEKGKNTPQLSNVLLSYEETSID